MLVFIPGRDGSWYKFKKRRKDSPVCSLFHTRFRRRVLLLCVLIVEQPLYLLDRHAAHEGVERQHIPFFDCEVEDVEILLEVLLAARGSREGRAVLHDPPQRDLV